MNFLRRLFKRRQHPRHYPVKGAYLVVAPYTGGDKKTRKVQILDISEGGCAFIYNGAKEDLEEFGFLDFLEGDAVFLDRVNFTTASDVPLPQTKESYDWLRRRGVEFKWLGIVGQQKLREFIERISIGVTR
jgi:c-di-GMP-binding flagellar brake protein YcgR